MNLDEDARDTLDGLKKSLKAKALSQKEVKDTLLPLLSCRDLSVRRQACSLLLSLLSTSPASTYSSLSPDILEALAILLSKLPGSLQLVAESSLTTSVLRIVDLLVGRAIISKPLLTKLAIFTATYSYSVAPVTSIRSKTISAPILSAQNRSNRKNRASTSASESETEYEQAYSRNSRKEIQLRMAALDCLTTIAQRDPIVLHPIWTTYLFSDPYAPLSPALLNIVENEVNIDLRLKAAGAVLAILGKAKQFMSIADQKARSSTAFVSLSARLAGVLTLLHEHLFRLLANPLLADFLLAMSLKILARLVANVPYARLQADLLLKAFERSFALARNPSEAVSFEALKAIESCSGAAFDASLLLPTEEALEYFLALDRPSWPAVGSLAMVSDDRLRLRILRSIAMSHQNAGENVKVQQTSAILCICKRSALGEEETVVIFEILQAFAHFSSQSVMLEVARLLSALVIREETNKHALQLNTELMDHQDSDAVLSICFLNVGSAIAKQTLEDAEYPLKLIKRYRSHSLEVIGSISWTLANLCTSLHTAKQIGATTHAEVVELVDEWSKTFPKDDIIRVNIARIYGGLASMIRFQSLFPSAGYASIIQALSVTNSAKIRWNAASAAQNILGLPAVKEDHVKVYQTLIDALSESLLDNGNIKIRLQSVEALSVIASSDSQIQLQTACEKLKILIARLKKEEDKLLFRQISQFGALQTKTSQCHSHLMQLLNARSS